ELDEDRPERFERATQPHGAWLGEAAPEEEHLPHFRQTAAGIDVEHDAVQAEAKTYKNDPGEAEEAHGSSMRCKAATLAGKPRRRNRGGRHGGSGCRGATRYNQALRRTS